MVNSYQLRVVIKRLLILITIPIFFLFAILSISIKVEKPRARSADPVFGKLIVVTDVEVTPPPPPWVIETRREISTFKSLKRRDGPYISSNFSLSPGLGNQMFQYAALFGFAQRFNATILMPNDTLIRRAFQFSRVKFVNPRFQDLINRESPTFYASYCCTFYPTITGFLSNSSWLNHHRILGYLQSWKYFDPIADEMRKEFNFREPIKTLAENGLASILAAKNVSRDNLILIGMHVRRGMDVTWNLRNQEHGHVSAPARYFLNAMKHFRDRFRSQSVIFVAVSDDIYWVKRTLTFPDVVYFASRIREVDLCALTLTQHTIMSQGTFSWWAAYLTNGDAIYYKNWPRHGSKLEQMVNRNDYFMPNWIGLDAV